MPSLINKAPEEIEIPIMKKIQNIFFILGSIMVLLTIGAYGNGDYGAMILVGLVAAGVFWIGSRIKTTKKAIGQTTAYR